MFKNTCIFDEFLKNRAHQLPTYLGIGMIAQNKKSRLPEEPLELQNFSFIVN